MGRQHWEIGWWHSWLLLPLGVPVIAIKESPRLTPFT